MRAARALPCLFWLKTRPRVMHKECQLGGPMGLRDAGTRIVTKEPRSTTAAVPDIAA